MIAAAVVSIAVIPGSANSIAITVAVSTVARSVRFCVPSVFRSVSSGTVWPRVFFARVKCSFRQRKVPADTCQQNHQPGTRSIACFRRKLSPVNERI